MSTRTWPLFLLNYLIRTLIICRYCYFIQISEDLASGKQLNTYDSLNSFIAIFDDVVEKIKERCGFKIVQIHQHRLHKNWENQKESSDIMSWVNSEILDLLKDINGNLDEKMIDTNSLGKKPSITPVAVSPSKKKKAGFLHRYILCPLNNTITSNSNQFCCLKSLTKLFARFFRKAKESDRSRGREAAAHRTEGRRAKRGVGP